MKSDEFTEEEIAAARAELKATVPPVPPMSREEARRELAAFFWRARRGAAAHRAEAEQSNPSSTNPGDTK